MSVRLTGPKARSALQIPLLSQRIADAASYLPAFIAGLLIIVVEFIVADFVGDAIERSASTTGSRVGSLLASGVQVFLYFIVIVVGLDTMQVDVEILYIFASAVAGGLDLALAIGLDIALGWVGRITSLRTSMLGRQGQYRDGFVGYTPRNAWVRQQCERYRLRPRRLITHGHLAVRIF